MKLVETAAWMLFLLGLMWWTAAPATASDSRGLYPPKWTMFGPVVHDNTLALGGSPRRSLLLSGENLKAIPSKLEINGKVYQSRQIDCPPGQAVDFDVLTEHNSRGATFYLFAVIETPEAAVLRMGAGVDWWMQWWLNGQPVFDTLDTGNRKSPIRADNHVFDLALERGTNILAAAIVRGSSSFAFAAGNPDICLNSSAYDAAMRWSRELLAHGGFFVKGAIDFKALREAYEMAVRTAGNYDQKIEALRRLAEARLNDPRDDDYEGIRSLCRELEELAEVDVPGGGTPLRRRAIERGRAVLGIGMAYLAEGRAAEARREFDRVEVARFGEIGGGTPPDDVCAMTAALLRDTAYQRAWSYIHERRYADAQCELDNILNMEGVSEGYGIGLRARQARETLRQLPRLRHDRPRMFFNADSWPCVMERALGRERAHFDAMCARVAGYSMDSANIIDSWQGDGAFGINQPEEWGMCAMEAAFVYRVTRDQATLAWVRRLLRATMDYFLSRTVTRCRSYPRVAFIAALDWVWDDLPPNERESLRSDLLEYVYTLHCEDKMVGHESHRTHYYERNVYRYAGMVIIDDDLDDVAYTRALEILARDAWLHVYGGDIKLRLEEGLTGHLTHGLVDYNTAEGQNELWPVLHMWESALGKRIPPELVHVVSPGFILRNTLGFNPGLLHFGYSRSWRTAGGQRTQLLYDHLAQSMYFFSATSPEQAGIARHLRERISREGVGGGAGQYPVFPFLIDIAAAPPAAIPSGMPIARHFDISGVILMSSGFSSGDTYALYSGGASRSEAHFDATHFTIYKKGWLALDSGTRAMLHAGAPGRHYDIQTVAHNAVLIYMADEEMPNGAVNSGGQRRYPSDAKLLAFESDRWFAYMATDATPVYHADKCVEMIRQFIFLPPNHFVVFDRVVSRRAEYPKTWLLHTANEPAIRGREFSAVQGQGKIFCRTLLPEDAVVNAIGGPGREFWAGDRNWAIPPSLPKHWLRGILDEDGNVCEQVGRWRIEMSPGAAREQDHFLHLIEVGDASAAEMAACGLIDDAGCAGVQFQVGMREYTVSLNKAGEVGGKIRIVAGGRVLVDRAFTNDVMPQHGLALMDACPISAHGGQSAGFRRDGTDNNCFDAGGDVAVLIRQLLEEQPGRLEDDPPAEAAVELVAAGEPAVTSLIAVLRHDRADARRLAAWVLGEMRADRAAKPLAELLDDDDGFVRAAAETALGRLGPSAAAEARRFLRAQREDTRLRAIRALGVIGGKAASQALVDLLQEETPCIRIAVVEALGRAGDPEICAAMIPLLEDGDASVCERTVWSLRQLLPPVHLAEMLEELGGFMAEGLAAPDPEQRAATAEVLAWLGEPAAGLAIRALHSAEAAGRREAAGVLGRIQTRDQRAFEPLLAALHDSTDDDLRMFTAAALGNLGDIRAVGPLTALLSADSPGLRKTAVEALGSLKDENSIAPLSELLHDADADLRLAAAKALAGMGAGALAPLQTALRDTERSVRDVAAEGLGNIGDHAGVPSLVAALTDEFNHSVPYVQQRAAAASRLKIIRALGQMKGHREAIAALFDLLGQTPRKTPRRDAVTLNAINRALENATGVYVYRGVIYPDRGYNTLLEDWQTWWRDNEASF